MRWIAYFILAYIMMGLQVGLSGVLRYQGAGVNFVLLAAVFIAMNAPRHAALLGCFWLGFMQDLTTQQPIGLFAFAYGLVAMFIVSTQPAVYRDHPLTHFSLVLAAGLMTGAVIVLQAWAHPTRSTEGAVRIAPTVLFATAIYTAVLAPFVLGLLQRIRRIFSFQPPRRRGTYKV
jgi:rod shape-determining protein MreD